MKKILVIAGEASGEKHAADLIEAISQQRSDYSYVGIGGDAMAAQGVQLLYHIRQLSVLGIAEVIRHLPFMHRVQKTIDDTMTSGVDAVILVDYPGFNLRIARLAKSRNIPVIYYISPQLWAWGEKRVAKVRRDVNLMLVLFQFEVDFYRKHGIEAHWVGHPLVDQVQVQQSETAFRKESQLPPQVPLLGLFPGSREMEVRQLLPVMLSAAERLMEETEVQPVIGMAGQLPDALYQDVVGDRRVKLLSGKSHALMAYARAAIVASGTATLELGYLQTPMTVLYRVSPLTYWLGKMLVKIDTIALANIVAGGKVVPELIQNDITTEAVFRETMRYFSDPSHRDAVAERLGAIRKALGSRGASRRAADKILAFLN